MTFNATVKMLINADIEAESKIEAQVDALTEIKDALQKEGFEDVTFVTVKVNKVPLSGK